MYRKSPANIYLHDCPISPRRSMCLSLVSVENENGVRNRRVAIRAAYARGRRFVGYGKRGRACAVAVTSEDFWLRMRISSLPIVTTACTPRGLIIEQFRGDEGRSRKIHAVGNLRGGWKRGEQGKRRVARSHRLKFVVTRINQTPT